MDDRRFTSPEARHGRAGMTRLASLTMLAQLAATACGL